jgi:hypothetical protein
MSTISSCTQLMGGPRGRLEGREEGGGCVPLPQQVWGGSVGGLLTSDCGQVDLVGLNASCFYSMAPI